MKNIYRLMKLIPSSFFTYQDAKRINQLYKEKSDKLDGAKVVFNTVRGKLSNIHLHIDLFLGRRLAEQGAKVFILLDDGCLNHWDTKRTSQLKALHNNTIDWNKLSPYLSSSILDRLNQFLSLRALLKGYKHPNLTIIFYSHILNEIEFDDIKLNNLDVNNAKRSTIRFFEDAIIRTEDPRHQAYFKKSLKNCKLSKVVGKYIVEDLAPDLFVTSHGFYSSWGSCYNLINKKGINTIVYSSHPYKFGYIQIKENNLSLHHSKRYDEFLKRELPKTERKKSEKIINERVNLKETNAKLHFSQYKGKFKKFDEKKIASGGYVFVAYPNVAWDVTSGLDSGIYDGIIDWMKSTIQCIADTKHHLIIRFHPSESSHLKGARTLRSLLEENDKRMFDHVNISIINPDEAINSYELASEIADIALVYNGSLGHELPLIKVPVIGVADGRFTREFVFQPNAQEEYLDWLKEPEKIIERFNNNWDQIKTSNLKYINYTYFKNVFDIPILSKDNRLEVSYDIENKIELEVVDILKERINC